MPSTESVAPSAARPIPLSLILMAAVAIHLPLLLMMLPLKSYDTNFHIFFASHYVHHWFNPWNPKWYAGFSQTTYPPLPQQWVALLSRIIGLNMAYMAVQFAAILLLAVGVYRFSLLWVSPRAASLAALASVLLGSESFLVYSAGQLGTTCAAPIYLNALPYLFDWLRYGKGRSFLKASVLFTAAAAAHHATLLFGSMFFALPVVALVLLDREGGEKTSRPALAGRTVTIVLVVTAAIAVVLLAVLDRADPISGHADSDSASQPGELHPEPAVGPELLRRSLRSSDSCTAIHPDTWIDGRPAASFAAGILGRISGGPGRNDSRWPSGSGPRL